jgi:hypothetical protein
MPKMNQLVGTPTHNLREEQNIEGIREKKKLRGILGSEKIEYGGTHRALSYLMKPLHLQS